MTRPVCPVGCSQEEVRDLGDLTLHPSHPLLRIFNLRNTRVIIIPEVEELLKAFVKIYYKLS